MSSPLARAKDKNPTDQGEKDTVANARSPISPRAREYAPGYVHLMNWIRLDDLINPVLRLPCFCPHACQVLDLSHCSLTDDDVSMLSKGLADPRCRLTVLRLAGNIDLRDRGAEGAFSAARRYLRCCYSCVTSDEKNLRYI